jgi:cytochrome P450
VTTTLTRFTPPRIVPGARPPAGLSLVATMLRNPLEAIPEAAYEEDCVDFGGGGGQRVWITSPALIKTVLLDERDKFRKLMQVRLLGPLLRKGILTSEGADWKWQRQASAPMFRPQELASFVPTFVRVSEELVARWRAAPGNVQRIDLDMTRATFDVVSATLLPSADQDTFERSVGVFQKSGGWGQLYAAMNMPKWFPRPGYLSGINAIARLRAAVGAMVGVRHRLHERGEQGPDDLLARLMAARDPETGQTMGDDQLVDNLLTFYLAGHETTAKALTWTLYLVARSPEWTRALQEEISRVTGGAPVAAEHIEKLVLVEQVVRESMRLFPPVPLMTRQADTDVNLGGRDLKPGASIIMPIYAIHRHSKRWVDPHVFDPTRFAPGREGEIARYQYMPFGAGPRICIGMSFAMIEATAMLATMLQHVRFETLDDREPVPVGRVTLMPKGGMKLRVTA